MLTPIENEDIPANTESDGNGTESNLKGQRKLFIPKRYLVGVITKELYGSSFEFDT